VIEGVVIDTGQPFFQVKLQHVHAIPDCCQNVPGVVVHAVAANAALSREELQQGPVTATKVEHALPLHYPAGDDVEVEATEDFGHVSIRSR
jgi:hypothetical protein